MICPFMSTLEQNKACQVGCALRIDNQCAIAIQAKAILEEQKKNKTPIIPPPLPKF